MVLQSTFTSQQEHVKFCLAAEGFGSKLCRLESTSNRKVKGFMSVRPGCSSSSPLLPVTLCQSLFCINNQQTCEMVQIKTKQFPQKLKIFELYRNTELLDLFFFITLNIWFDLLWRLWTDMKLSPVLFVLLTSARTFLQICPYVASSCPSVSPSEPCRRRWPTLNTWLQRWLFSPFLP